MENINIQIHNRFDIVVRDGITGEIKQEAKAENILLNAFWTNFIGVNNGMCLNYIHFGSGSATPLATDTTLTTFIAGKICATDVKDFSTFYTDGIAKRKRSIRIEMGEQVGATISEVGFAESATSTKLRTKALLKDVNNNPISILIGATDVVDIFATFFFKCPLSINEGKVYFDTSNNPSAYILGMCLCCGPAAYNDDSYFYTHPQGVPKCLSTNYDSAICVAASGLARTFDVANKKMTITFNNLVAGSGNKGGLGMLRYGNLTIELPQTGFTQPVITKEVIGTGDGVNKDFYCAFGRILNNGTAKLFVNDVEVAATFDFLFPHRDAGFGASLKMLSGGIYDRYNPMIFENPYYEKIGLTSCTGYQFKLYASNTNNGSDWALASDYPGSSGGFPAITATYKNYRYWKLIPYTVGGQCMISDIKSSEAATYKPIHAVDAPANGATVALTYQPNVIAKDANHVVNNMSLAFTFNEYTPT